MGLKERIEKLRVRLQGLLLDTPFLNEAAETPPPARTYELTTTTTTTTTTTAALRFITDESNKIYKYNLFCFGSWPLPFFAR